MRNNGYLVLLSLVLSGCYNNWHELDAFVNQIDCDTTKSQAISLANSYQAVVSWDKTYRLLSIGKEQDAVAIQFVAESYGSSIIKLDTVSAVKSHITFFGLDRRQGDIQLILRCAH